MKNHKKNVQNNTKLQKQYIIKKKIKKNKKYSSINQKTKKKK